MRPTPTPCVCETCGVTFFRPAWLVRTQSPRFCSRACFGKGFTGERSHLWKGGGWLTHQGYICISRHGQRVLEHRAIMETHLGRPLLRTEHVHHINGVKTDNRVENLELLPEGIHHRLHATTPGWSRKHDCCVKCGTTARGHVARGLCKNCYSNVQYHKRHAPGSPYQRL